MNQNLFFCDFIVKKLESQLNYFQLCCVSEQQRWAAKKATRKCLYTFCQLFALRLRVTFVFRALSPELLALTLVLLEPGNYSTYFAKKKVKNFLFYFFRKLYRKNLTPLPGFGQGCQAEYLHENLVFPRRYSLKIVSLCSCLACSYGAQIDSLKQKHLGQITRDTVPLM